MNIKQLILPIAISATIFLSACGDSSKPAGEYLIDAWGALDKQNVRGAEIAIKNGIQNHPENAELRAEHARLFNLLGNGAAAEVAIIKARDLGYQPAKSELVHLEAILHQNRPDEVIEKITSGAQLKDAILEASRQRLLAEAYLQKRDMKSARAAMDLSLSLNKEDTQTTITLANLEASSGNLDKAKNLLDELLKAQPLLGKAWSLLGDIHRFEKNLESAVVAYDRAIENSYNIRKILFNRALANLSLKKYDAVRADAKKIKGRQEQDLLAMYLNGLADLDEKKYDEALVNFQKIHSLSENYPTVHYFLGLSYLINGNAESAENHFSLHLGQYKGPQTRVRLLLAAAKQQNGDVTGAERVIDEILVNDPKNEQALNAKSGLLLKQGKGDESAKIIQSLIAEGTDSEALYLRLGLSQLVAGQSKEATAALSRALQINENTHQATTLLIFQAMQNKDYKKALELTEGFIQKAPDQALPYSLKGTAYAESGDLKNAEQAFLKAWEIAPGAEPVGRSLARIYLKFKETDKAVDIYRKILDKNPKSTVSRIELAQLLLAQKDGKGFELQLKEAIKQNPNDYRPVVLLLRGYLAAGLTSQATALMDTLPNNVLLNDAVREVAGIVYFQTRDFKKALKPIEALVTKYSNNTQFKIYLAGTLRELGQLDRANKILTQALQNQPTDKNLLAALAEVQLRQQDVNGARQTISQFRQQGAKEEALSNLEGTLAAVEKNYSRAAFHFNNLQQKQPNSLNLNKYASMLNKAGQADKAIASVEQWLSVKKTDVASWMLLAELKSQQNDQAGTEDAYRKLLEIQANNPLALNNLANLLIDKDIQQARKLADRALQILPETPAIIDTAAWISHKQGDSQRALQLLRQIPEKQLSTEIKRHLDEVLKAIAD